MALKRLCKDAIEIFQPCKKNWYLCYFNKMLTFTISTSCCCENEYCKQFEPSRDLLCEQKHTHAKAASSNGKKSNSAEMVLFHFFFFNDLPKRLSLDSLWLSGKCYWKLLWNSLQINILFCFSRKNLTMHIQLSAKVVLTKSYFKRVTDILLYHLVFMLPS